MPGLIANVPVVACVPAETWANCPSILFGDAGTGSWPVGCGHPCIGCTEEGVGFTKPIHSLAVLKTVTPPTQFARPAEEQGQGATIVTAGAAAIIGGLAIGAGLKLADNLGKRDSAKKSDDQPGK